MKLLITNALICDPQSAFNGKTCDLLIHNGIIEQVQPAGKAPREGKTFDAKGACISPGWFDMRAALREPGHEFKEDLASGAQAAAAGGFTSVACLPTTQPAIQSKADIEFIYRRAEALPIHIFPYGAITKDREGKDMNELYDMHQAGAVGFTDGNRSIAHAGVLLRAMMYAKTFSSMLLNHAEDTDLSAGGRMHEGPVSTGLGLKGLPSIAEELVIVRDIELAKYAEVPVHISHISSRGSVELIRKAKKQGVQVTCDVAVANLVYTDESLTGFDSTFKLNPPLRSKADRKSLWDGLADGTIDCIVTDHHPEDVEHKDVEFEYAAPGMIQLQTAYALLNMHAPKGFTTDMLVQALSVNPRKILKRDALKIEKGAQAELTVFDPGANWTYDLAANRSRSRNSPVLNTTLKGKCIAIINKDQLIRS